MKPQLMANGGAWCWEDSLDARKAASIERALGRGYQILLAGESALDAVEMTVRALEDDPIFNLSQGRYDHQDDAVLLDALVVDGATLDFGAVACVTKTLNPVSLARRMMEETDQPYLVGEAADQLLEDLGLRQLERSHLGIDPTLDGSTKMRVDGPRNTVGAVALDKNGNLACATMTGGSSSMPSALVGDYPLYGASGYAENGRAAAVATGSGEHVARSLFSKHVCGQVNFWQDAATAAKAGARRFEKLFPDSMAGVIVIDQYGHLGAAQTAPKMAFGWIDHSGTARASMKVTDLGYPAVLRLTR